jgi:hypothetical protein
MEELFEKLKSGKPELRKEAAKDLKRYVIRSLTSSGNDKCN